MSLETVNRVLAVLAASPTVSTLDITGGAPEMNTAFRPLVEGASALGIEIIDFRVSTFLFYDEDFDS